MRYNISGLFITTKQRSLLPYHLTCMEAEIVCLQPILQRIYQCSTKLLFLLPHHLLLYLKFHCTEQNEANAGFLDDVFSIPVHYLFPLNGSHWPLGLEAATILSITTNSNLIWSVCIHQSSHPTAWLTTRCYRAGYLSAITHSSMSYHSVLSWA